MAGGVGGVKWVGRTVGRVVRRAQRGCKHTDALPPAGQHRWSLSDCSTSSEPRSHLEPVPPHLSCFPPVCVAAAAACQGGRPPATFSAFPSPQPVFLEPTPSLQRPTPPSSPPGLQHPSFPRPRPTPSTFTALPPSRNPLPYPTNPTPPTAYAPRTPGCTPKGGYWPSPACAWMRRMHTSASPNPHLHQPGTNSQDVHPLRFPLPSPPP